MPDPIEIFERACKAFAPDAAVLGFPPFGAGLGAETPLNSSPYVFDFQGLLGALGYSQRRRTLLEKFEHELVRLSSLGVAWQMALLGGTMLDRKTEPSDLDALVLYAVAADRQQEANLALRNFAGARQSSAELDIHLCPVDTAPLVLIKRILFFAGIFAFDKQTAALTRGTILLVPAKTSPIVEDRSVLNGCEAG